MRSIRMAVFGAAALALVVGACTSGGGSSSPSAAPATASPAPASVAPASGEPVASEPASSGPSIASLLAFGGPPECPKRPYCLLGLQETYGLQFKEFVALDSGGPLTVEALKAGNIGIGVLFTSDPAVGVNGFVLLEDDKHLQLADNVLPVVRKEVLDANPEVADLLNAISAKLTQTALNELNTKVTVDGQTPADAATVWLSNSGLLPGAGGSGKGSVVVGSTNFYEQEILGELYAQVLEANGFEVERKFQLGPREIVFPALQSGEIQVLAEYAASALEYVNGGAGEATADGAETAARLAARLDPMGLTALPPAEATDQNGYAVTAQTAATYGLVTISDLARPAP